MTSEVQALRIGIGQDIAPTRKTLLRDPVDRLLLTLLLGKYAERIRRRGTTLRGTQMCASCGCSVLDDDHGDYRNITMADLEEAASAAGISVEEVARNIQEAVFEVEEEIETSGE